MFTSLCLQVTLLIQNAAELHSIYVATCIVNGLCSVVAVTCNLVVILAIVCNSSLRTPSYVLLCNLAISDLGMGLMTQPLYIALRVAEARGQIDLSCKLGAAYYLIGICLACLSFVTLTAISVDRFLAVYLAIKYRSTVTVKKAKLLMVSLWLIAVTVAIIFVLNMTVYFIIIIIVISCCLLFTSCNYFAIGRMLQRRYAQTQAHNHIQTGQHQHNWFNIGRYKKTMTTMLYVYGAFLLCYLPSLCFFVALKLIGLTITMRGANLITLTIVFSNSALNPVLYYWRMPELRLRINQLLGRGARESRSTRVMEYELNIVPLP